MGGCLLVPFTGRISDIGGERENLATDGHALQDRVSHELDHHRQAYVARLVIGQDQTGRQQPDNGRAREQ